MRKTVYGLKPGAVIANYNGSLIHVHPYQFLYRLGTDEGVTPSKRILFNESVNLFRQTYPLYFALLEPLPFITAEAREGWQGMPVYKRPTGRGLVEVINKPLVPLNTESFVGFLAADSSGWKITATYTKQQTCLLPHGTVTIRMNCQTAHKNAAICREFFSSSGWKRIRRFDQLFKIPARTFSAVPSSVSVLEI